MESLQHSAGSEVCPSEALSLAPSMARLELERRSVESSGEAEDGSDPPVVSRRGNFGAR